MTSTMVSGNIKAETRFFRKRKPLLIEASIEPSPRIYYSSANPIPNSKKAEICELYRSGVPLKKLTGVGTFRIHKIISKCLFGVPKTEDTITIVLQSKINENE